MKLLDADGTVKIVDTKSNVFVDDVKCNGSELVEKLGTYRGIMQYNATEDGKSEQNIYCCGAGFQNEYRALHRRYGRKRILLPLRTNEFWR